MKLEALPYHVEAVEHLRACESAHWDWFESDDFSSRYAESVKLELLKSAYRLTRADVPALHELADAAAGRLGLDLPVALYQKQGGSAEANAALVFLPDELAVMLMGGVAELLDEAEMLALLGHEFSHRRLYGLEGGRYLTASRLLEWCCAQPRCELAYRETDRLYGLHSEVFADMGALHVAQDRDAVISCLIKVTTGLKTVTASSYLDQADEILEKYRQGSEGLTHPELFIRAKTLGLAASQQPWLDEMGAMLRGPLDVRRLDLLGQRELNELTRRLLDQIADQPFMRSEQAVSLGERYFPGFQWAEEWGAAEEAEGLGSRIAAMGGSSHEYFSYVLLDFATVGPHDGDGAALAWTLDLAEKLGLFSVYEPIARRELKRRKEDLAKLRRASSYKIARANHA